ncbi:hypothetical protein [Rhodococcoides trifolii]|uniref:hypothetical protein n=1 Tax=Rhodococcoides trifolii TaxID=908250 RepID=UPI001E60F957|nr:hypothetical protein [Rhodococcus trifolii]
MTESSAAAQFASLSAVLAAVAVDDDADDGAALDVFVPAALAEEVGADVGVGELVDSDEHATKDPTATTNIACAQNPDRLIVSNATDI